MNYFAINNVLIIPMDWKIGFYRRYFVDISNIGWPRNEIQYRLLNGRNIGKIGEKIEREAMRRAAKEACQNIGDI